MDRNIKYCIMDCDDSVKLTRKPLKTVEIANTTIH